VTSRFPLALPFRAPRPETPRTRSNLRLDHRLDAWRHPTLDATLDAALDAYHLPPLKHDAALKQDAQEPLNSRAAHAYMARTHAPASSRSRDEMAPMTWLLDSHKHTHIHTLITHRARIIIKNNWPHSNSDIRDISTQF
jgi:hypothetical protein